MDWVRTLALIKAEEGLRLTAYQCSAGKWTIGYGHNLEAHGYLPNRAATVTWTRAQAEDALNVATQNLYSLLISRWPWVSTLSDARKAVLLSMAYQMGLDGLAKFKRTLRAVEQGAYVVAADCMLQSLWAGQTPARATRAARMMADDAWPLKVNGHRIP